MIEPLDRSRRDSTLFQFTTRQLRDFIDPNHLLIQIDERLDFAKLVEPLEDCYCPDFGRPAIHPKVMGRALLIYSLYNVASFRRLCSAISENIIYRWFCFLTIDDPVFDHSSISHFIDRIGRDDFSVIFDGLNDELPRLGMWSPEMYVDASLVKASVSGYDLAPTSEAQAPSVTPTPAAVLIPPISPASTGPVPRTTTTPESVVSMNIPEPQKTHHSTTATRRSPTPTLHREWTLQEIIVKGGAVTVDLHMYAAVDVRMELGDRKPDLVEWSDGTLRHVFHDVPTGR